MKISAILVGAALVSGAGLGGVAGAAAASKSSAPKIIYACAAKSNGAARLVPKPSSCGPRETRVAWNQAGRRGPQGVRGATGATGATGPAGPAGPSGLAGIQYEHQTFIVSATSSELADVSCPDGTVPIGGGAHFSNVFSGVGNASGGYVSESDIDDANTGWAATLVNNFNAPAEFSADAICAIDG